MEGKLDLDRKQRDGVRACDHPKGNKDKWHQNQDKRKTYVNGKTGTVTDKV